MMQKKCVMYAMVLAGLFTVGAAFSEDQSPTMSIRDRMYEKFQHLLSLRNNNNADRSAEAQTQLTTGCGVSFDKCLTEVQANTTSVALDFVWRQCDNSTCGCAQRTALSCNETCYAQHTGGQLQDCLLYDCSVSPQRPAGTQLSEISFYDSEGVKIDLTAAVVTSTGDTFPGEGTGNLVDGDINTQWLDSELAADITINVSTPIKPQFFSLTTGNADPGRDPIYFSVFALDSITKTYVKLATVDGRYDDYVGNATFTPNTSLTQSGKLDLFEAVNAYDNSQGPGACADALSGSFNCADNFCPSCTYAHYCDKECNLPGAAASMSPSTSFLIKIYSLRNNGICDGAGITDDEWWSEEQEIVRDKCGVPYLATKDWWCFSNHAGKVNCSKSGDACRVDGVQWQYDEASQVSYDIFESAPCGYVETCDDSGACLVDSLKQYLDFNPDSISAEGHVACNQMFNCIHGKAEDWTHNCTGNRVTIDWNRQKCNQSAICDNLNVVLTTLPEGEVNCALEHAEFYDKQQPEYLREIETKCAVDSCQHLGFGTPGNCKGGKMDCCMSVPNAAEEPVVSFNISAGSAEGQKIFKSKYLSCAETEYSLNFLTACPNSIAPKIFTSDEKCDQYTESLMWNDRLVGLEVCLGNYANYTILGNDGVVCNKTRVCDMGSTFYPRCDSKPIGLQTCSSVWFDNKWPLLNMTADADGTCRCPATHDCDVASGYCQEQNTIPITGVPAQDLTTAPATDVPVPSKAPGLFDTLVPFTAVPSIQTWTFTPNTGAPKTVAPPTPSPWTPSPPWTNMPGTALPGTSVPNVPPTAVPVTALPLPPTTTALPATAVPRTPLPLPPVATGLPITGLPETAVPVTPRTPLPLPPVATGLPTTGLPETAVPVTPRTALPLPPIVTGIPVSRTTAPETRPPPTSVPMTRVPLEVNATYAPDTSAPATAVPPTNAPPTSAPATSVPMTRVPLEVNATYAPDTSAPATDVPPTNAPPTSAPATSVPMTRVPLEVNETYAPDTSAPATAVPPTNAPPTSAPATSVPMTRVPLEVNETYPPDTSAPATDVPPTNAPPTSAPPTSVPMTRVPLEGNETYAPDTDAPATAVPPTSAPPTSAPATSVPVTRVPLEGNDTYAPDTDAPATAAPATSAPATNAPMTRVPLEGNNTYAPDTDAPSSVSAPDHNETLSPDSAGAPEGMYCSFVSLIPYHSH